MNEFEDELCMMKDFPLLFPCDFNKSWKGYVLLNMQEIEMVILCPNFPQLSGLKVDIHQCNSLNLHSFDLREFVERIKSKTNSLPEFLKNFISELAKIWKPNISTELDSLTSSYHCKTFCNVIKEINSFPQYVHTIDGNLKHVTFNILDECKRNHFIKIYIPEEYSIINEQALIFETEVPFVALNSLLKINTILKLVEEFKRVVHELNNFWNVYDEIIQTCNVIGFYTLSDVIFKIPIDYYHLPLVNFLDYHAYVEVEINPYNPKSCPIFKIYGQPESREKFQLKLNEIDPIMVWSSEKSYEENMLNVFKIASLQSQYKDNNQDIVEESANNVNNCFICYDQLDTTAKKQIKTCINEKCDSLYHMSCICEWLLNSGSTPMFEHLQGKCPQCEEEMLVALDNFDLIKT